MSEFSYSFQQLCNKHKEGSFNTRASREKVGRLICDELREAGFKLKSVYGLKPKHVSHLVAKWQEEEKSASTIKNRMSILRWAARKIGKPNIISRNNDDYGIEKRQSKPEGKAKELDNEKVAKINDPYVRLSLRLQREFGMRREESIKFVPSYAIHKDYIQLRGSWTKGGKPRAIPITSNTQRALLQALTAIPKGRSLIPESRSYKQQLGLYNRECIRVGLHKNHGLRHQYARQRYLELTGWRCPADGGPRRRDLMGEQKDRDIAARLEISLELGHNRFSVTYTYLGS